MRLIRFFSIITAVLFLSACAETQFGAHLFKSATGSSGNEGQFKVGNPYRAGSQWYTPQETYNYSETGIASWYGAEFQGHRTANGEIFDKNELTAAHRTLQMPSLVRVTNLDNGRSLVVRVNDRGPFARGRVIDVTQRAAQLLGFYGPGTAKVRVDLLPTESKTLADAARRGQSTQGIEVAVNERAAQAPVSPAEESGSGAPLTGEEGGAYQQAAMVPNMQPTVEGHVKHGEFLPDPVIGHEPVHPTSIYIQAGSFGSQSNAANMAAKLRKFGQAQVVPALVNGRQFYRVRVGPVPDVPAADVMLDRLTRAGFSKAITVVN